MEELTEQELDEQISKLKIEVFAHIRNKRKAFDSAVKFHNDMCTGRRKKTDKNLTIHQRAIEHIRSYKRTNPAEWELYSHE